MKLSADELKWIDARVKTYQVKFGNVYDEILDHIISAIEEERLLGNNRDIETLFQQVIDGHFGGAEGIEKLVVKHEHIYKQSIKKLWMQSLSNYLNWPVLCFAIVVLLLSLTLPNVMAVKLSILIVCTLLACSPVIYAHFWLKARVLKAVDGKLSFLKMHLMSKISMPAALLITPFYYLPRHLIYNLPPIILMAALMLFVLLNLTAINFCRQFTAANPVTK